MKRSTAIIIFIGTQLFLILLQIHKQSLVVRYSYTKQKYEQEKQELLNKKQELINSLYTLQNQQRIKEFATEKLGMKPVRLKQIKRLKTQADKVNESII